MIKIVLFQKQEQSEFAMCWTRKWHFTCISILKNEKKKKKLRKMEVLVQIHILNK